MAQPLRGIAAVLEDFESVSQVKEILRRSPEALRGVFMERGLVAAGGAAVPKAKALIVARTSSRDPRGLANSPRAVAGQPKYRPSALLTAGSSKRRGIKAAHANLIELGWWPQNQYGGRYSFVQGKRFLLDAVNSTREKQLAAFARQISREWNRMWKAWEDGNRVTARNRRAIRSYAALRRAGYNPV